MALKYTEFKGLNLPAIEQEILAKWKHERAFEQSIELREGAEPFVFYEGPPSANGLPGIHHVISRTLKDLVCRYKTMKGYQVKRKGGWDTHGLPIELGVEKELGITKEDIGKKISVEEYNNKCREAVLRYKKEWDDITTQMGYWVDLENPYITFENKYIETLWWILKTLYNKDLLYESVSIQPYSPAAGTGLSSHELNQPGTYKDVKDTSATVMFRAAQQPKTKFLHDAVHGAEVFFMAWTTTPWTLPSNLGLTVGPSIDYVLVKTFNPYTHLPINVILAKNLVGKYFKEEGEKGDFENFAEGVKLLPWKIIAEFKGSDLEGCTYEQLLPFEANSMEVIQEITPDAKPFVVMCDSFVTTEDGTGIVHTAPAFGADDYKVGKKNNIGILTMVDKQGKFVEGLGEFSNRYVKNYKDEKDYVDVNVDICVKLKLENRAFKIEKYEHSYPHCWRTDKPILYYPLDAWFIKTTALKDKMVALNKTINWKPASTGTGRFGNWLENMVDWNLSRSRFWGTPLPIWKSVDGDGNFIDEKEGGESICIGTIAELKDTIYASNEFYCSKSRVENFDTEREIFLGKKAIDKALATQSDIEYAVCRKDIEGYFIHFLWGVAGDASKQFSDGYGISKIVAKRKTEGLEATDILYRIVSTLAKGKINRIFGPENNKRIELEFDNCIAFINEYWEKDKYNWLLTGFVRKNETGEIGEICDTSDSTQIIPTHTQNNLGAVSDVNISYQFIQPIFRFNTNDLHKPYVDDIILLSPTGKPMKRVPDLIDVWFDSGAMPYAQWGLDYEKVKAGDPRPFNAPFGTNYPASFIAEGVDQTRGWFYTLHAISSLLYQEVAYKTVVSNGLVLDKNGVKMSKRLGNVVDPTYTLNKYGADATRWYLITNTSPWDNIKFSWEKPADKPEFSPGIEEVQRKFFGTIYNTYQFFALYSNVDGFAFKEAYMPMAERPEIDRWILSSLNTLIKTVTASMDDYEPTAAGRAIEVFVDEHLSNWYVRLCRRRFWKGEYEQDKICAYQTLYECLETILRLMAPISPFFSDAIFCNLNAVTGRHSVASIHHVLYPVADEGLIDKALEERMQLAQDTCSLLLSIRKNVRIKVRQPLQKVLIPVMNDTMQQQLSKIEDLIKAEVNIKEIEYLTDTEGFIRKKIKPNFIALGKKLGPKMKAVTAAMAGLQQHDIATIEKTGQLDIVVDGELLTLMLSEVDIAAEDIPGWSVASKGSLTVALDISISPELKLEGDAREFVNKIQGIRKDQGFNLTDRILVSLVDSEILRNSINAYKTYICGEILADSLEWVPAVTDGTEIEVNETKIIVSVIKKGA